MQEIMYLLLKDFIFKQVFGNRKNTANLSLLLRVLLPLEGEEMESLKIENTFVERSWNGDKLIILDIRVTTKSGKMFNVELQIEKSRYFRNRLVYYQSKLITEQLRRGVHYDKLRPVYCIAICNFRMLPDESRYIHHFVQTEKASGEVFTDMQNIIIIELPKMPEFSDGSAAWPVLKCFRCKDMEEAEMHAKTYPGVREIVADLREFSLVKELRSAYDLFQKTQRDRKMWEDEYFLQGAEQEREKWEAVRSENKAVMSENEAVHSKNKAVMFENEAVRSENKAVMSENEALRRELERMKSERK